MSASYFSVASTSPPSGFLSYWALTAFWAFSKATLALSNTKYAPERLPSSFSPNSAFLVANSAESLVVLASTFACNSVKIAFCPSASPLFSSASRRALTASE